MTAVGLSTLVVLLLILGGMLLVSVIVLIIIFAGSKKKTASRAPAAPAPTPPVPPCRPVPSDPAISAGIARNAPRFMGLYESIYTSVSNPAAADPGAYREWHVRMQNLVEDCEFYAAFSQQFPRNSVTPAHMQQLLSCIYAAGITRSTETVHTATPASREAYVYLGTGPLIPGNQYKVLRPCWSLNGRTVEQGILS